MANGPRIGFIGLGEMGGAVSHRLFNQGCSIVAYDLSSRAMEKVVAWGAVAGSSPRDVAARAETVIMSLPTSRQVEAVCLGPAGIIEGAVPGTVVIDLTSGNHPDTLRIGQALGEKGIQLVDVGISGIGGTTAYASLLQGRLTLMVGADDELFARVRPTLDLFADRVFHVGPAGGGHLTKSLVNFLNATTLLATAEAMVVAAKAGLDPKAVISAIDISGGRSFSSMHRFPNFVLKGDFGPASSGKMQYLRKDLRQALDFGHSVEVPMLISGLIHDLLIMAEGVFGSDVASTNAMRLYEQWAGVEVREREEPQA